VTDETHSRWLNMWLYGDPEETFCSRVYRWRWLPWCAVLWLWIDAEAVRRAGEEWGHCAAARENDRVRRLAERLRRADALDERARLAGL
jgi:hypothetical protein